MAGSQPSNYSGQDPRVIEGQAAADASIREIVRLKAEGKSTLTAADRLDLQELVVAWDNAYDALDRDGVLSVVTDDVEFVCPAFGTHTRNKEEMGKWYDEFTRAFTGKRHLLTNFVAVGDANSARMLSYLTVFERILHTEMVGSAVYYDEFRKENGRWLISRRQQFVDPGMTETTYGKSLIEAYSAIVKA